VASPLDDRPLTGGKTSGGGLRAALADILEARVPTLRSLASTWILVLGVLVTLAAVVGLADEHLARTLTWSRLPMAGPIGWVGIAALLAAAVEILRLPLTLTGDAPAYLHRERRRLRRALWLLALALLAGLYWTAGRALPA
jgi:hypothetical protein